MAERILIVDDERAIADLVEVYLRNEGYQTVICENAADALKAVREGEISLAVLDVMLPDMDGFALLQKIREGHFFPIIMLTAKIETGDKINGLSLGADDYITKPFDPPELIARVKTQLRRFISYNRENKGAEESEISVRGLYICKDSRKCTKNGKEIPLTPLEFDILWYLCSKKGSVATFEELYEAVWGEKYFESNNTI
ncbi:MAG: response regulator transcription factor, partial [Ruminiclostridium sp.]|nr:response regulator transcription factor [Ruminiclostridium sp.]